MSDEPTVTEPSSPVVSPGARAAAAAALAVLVVLSGTLLGRAGSSPAPRAAPGAHVASGAWFCPHGGGAGWKGWLAVVNPGPSPVRVRATTFGSTTGAVAQTFTVLPRREVYREVAVADPAASTEVEYFGGWVAAGTIVRSDGSNADVAAERCVDGLSGQWLMPDETTAPDEHASVIVMNPYATLAEFDVTIRTNLRSLHPGILTPAVLQPHTSTAIAVETWARAGPSEDAVTVQVQSVVGRVVAGSMVSSPAGIRAEAGIPSPAERWVIPAAGYGDTARLEVVNPGRSRAGMTVVAEGPSGPNTVPGASGTSIGPGGARTFDVGSVSDAGVHVDAGKGRIAAGFRLSGPNGGAAAVVGWSQVGASWAVPPTLPVTGGTARLVLQNPGRAAATVRVEWISPDGPVAGGPAAIHVAPGHTVTVQMPASQVPLFALVTAVSGSIVPGETSQSLGSVAFAATTGVPLP